MALAVTRRDALRLGAAPRPDARQAETATTAGRRSATHAQAVTDALGWTCRASCLARPADSSAQGDVGSSPTRPSAREHQAARASTTPRSEALIALARRDIGRRRGVGPWIRHSRPARHDWPGGPRDREAAPPERGQPPRSRPIIPAATVLLLASSTRMNEPVARFCWYGSTNSGCVARSWIRPISFSESSVGVLVAVERVDVDPVVDRLDQRPAPSASCA